MLLNPLNDMTYIENRGKDVRKLKAEAPGYSV